jgi:methionyl-tRNA synthetase
LAELQGANGAELRYISFNLLVNGKRSPMSRILITSALPYINGVKHLGNLVGSMLPADVYARYMRMRGHDVLAICATDEHGTPAELAALKAGQDVATFCAEQHAVQKAFGEAFCLEWDYFGRSSSPQNHKLTQHFAELLEKNGLIEERVDEQVYSIDDERFLPDRYIEGTCPKCDYEKARGDQCDNCGSLLDPVDLKDAYSTISGSKNLEVRQTRHLYLLQSKMVSEIRDLVQSRTDWSPLVSSIASKWLDEGLNDRCITRDLKWGIPVLKDGKPRPGFEDKVFYVWFDAPIEYIGATQEWAAEGQGNRMWEPWWYGDEAKDVSYVQFMGKDNVPFHTVSFPVTLLGSGEPWKSADKIKGFNWLNWYGGKFSTSMDRGVFMDQALELLPVDYWRYYLMANAPEGSDASFTWEHFSGTVNKDLADVLGNFVNRILRFTKSKFDLTVPEGGSARALEEKLSVDLSRQVNTYAGHLEALEFRKALQELRSIWVLGNEYLTEAAPWTAFKEDPDEAAVGVRTGINLIRIFALLAWPVIPETAMKMLKALGREDEAGTWPIDIERELQSIGAGQVFTIPDVLFAKIDDEQVEKWKTRFGGVNDEASTD